MIGRPRRKLLAVSALVASCGGGRGGGGSEDGGSWDAGVDMAAARTGGARVSIAYATLAEGDGAARSKIAFGVDLENTGDLPVMGFGVVAAMINVGNLTLPLNYFLTSPVPQLPVVPEEVRRLDYTAEMGSLALCSGAVRGSPNPHHGLATMGLRFVSNVGGVAINGSDLAVTCPPATTTPPPDRSLACDKSIEQACGATDASGGLDVRCALTSDEVLADSYYCGMAASDELWDCPGYRARIVTSGRTSNRYYYEPMRGALVAIVGNASSGEPVCLGAASPRFTQPSCPSRLPGHRCSGPPGDGGGEAD